MLCQFLHDLAIRILTGFYIWSRVCGIHVGGVDYHRHQPGERYSRAESFRHRVRAGLAKYLRTDRRDEALGHRSGNRVHNRSPASTSKRNSIQLQQAGPCLNCFT